MPPRAERSPVFLPSWKCLVSSSHCLTAPPLYYTPSPYVKSAMHQTSAPHLRPLEERLQPLAARIGELDSCNPLHSTRRMAPAGPCWYNQCMTLIEITYELQSSLQPEQLRALGNFAYTYGLRRFRVD